MPGKPKLYYFDGRGKMESVRWLLATAGVEFEEEFLETRARYEALLQDGALLFEQLPLVEIDGMKLVQTTAILQYIAAKYNLYGKDLKERALKVDTVLPEANRMHKTLDPTPLKAMSAIPDPEYLQDTSVRLQYSEKI